MSLQTAKVIAPKGQASSVVVGGGGGGGLGSKSLAFSTKKKGKTKQTGITVLH